MSGMMCAAIGMLQRKFSAMGKVRGWIRGDEREREDTEIVERYLTTRMQTDRGWVDAWVLIMIPLS